MTQTKAETNNKPKRFDIPVGRIGDYAEEAKDPSFMGKLTGNLQHIPKIQRMMKFEYPEFNWQMTLGDEETRCYQKFAQYISRFGYDDRGKVWSVIYPQQGLATFMGNVNIKITVTGVRGWIDENKKKVSSDIGVKGQVWFSTESKCLKAFNRFMHRYKGTPYEFPLSKINAIKQTTHKQGDPSDPHLCISSGVNKIIRNPKFAEHP